MRIALLGAYNSINFNGVTKKVKDESYDDNANEVMVTEVKYDYYPFLDETQEQIEKVQTELNKTEYDPRPYPSWSSYYESKVEIKPALSITEAQYKAIKTQKVKDDFIIKTFA